MRYLFRDVDRKINFFNFNISSRHLLQRPDNRQEPTTNMVKLLFALAIFSPTSLLNAANNSQVDKFLMSFKCQYCDLSGADFSRRELEGSDLMNANLSGSDLSYVNFEPRKHEKKTVASSFENANLRGADFSGANLVNATMINAYLREANFSNASLRGADLRDANLKGAVLEGADLKGADLTGAKVTSEQMATAITCKTKTADGSFLNLGC